MAITVDWYKRFGERWWGDITKVLTPFPTVEGKEVVGDPDVGLIEEVGEEMVVDGDDNLVLGKKRKLNGSGVESGLGRAVEA